MQSNRDTEFLQNEIVNPKSCSTHLLTTHDYKCFLRLIGQGMSQIYSGSCKNNPAAIKLYWHDRKKFFDSELSIFEFIAHFPNTPADANYLIQYYGYDLSCSYFRIDVDIPLPSAIVMELADAGSLDSYIVDPKKILSVTNKRLILVDITKGINVLHQYYGLVHNDLKSGNVFLKTEGALLRAKIGDFNCSKHKDNNKILPCTPAYASPEVLLLNKQDYKSDIFSMGIVVWELCTKQIAQNTYRTMNRDYTFTYRECVAEGKQRLPIPKDISETLGMFIQNCWAHDPELRPNINECVEISNSLTDDDFAKSKLSATAGTLFYQPKSATNAENQNKQDFHEESQNRNLSTYECCTIV